MKLGELLIRNAVIGQSQLDAALRNQVLYGGRLGTNLVELGYLDLDGLGQGLAEQLAMPAATTDLLEAAAPDLLTKLGPRVALLHGALPLRRLPDTTPKVAVAFIDPNARHDLDAVATVLNAAVARYVMPELRARYFIEKHFGLPRSVRFVRSGGTVHQWLAQPASDDRRRAQPAGGIVMPPTFTLQPRRRRQQSTQPPLSHASSVTPFDEILQRLTDAAHRDQLAAALMRFAAGRLSLFAAFLVRDGNALGWCAATPSHAGATITSVALPLGGVSALQEAHDSQKPFRGLPPCVPHPVESALWQALDTSNEPVEIMVAPVVVRQRVAALLYGHGNRQAGTLDSSLAQELTIVAERLAEAFARLMVQATT